MRPRRAGCALGALGALEAALEPLDLACGVEDHLLAREERVAAVADVDAQLGSSRADLEDGATGGALHVRLLVLGMDLRLHLCNSQAPSVRFPVGGRPWSGTARKAPDRK